MFLASVEMTLSYTIRSRSFKCDTGAQNPSFWRFLDIELEAYIEERGCKVVARF